MTDPAFDFWLANEGDRTSGVAIATGQPTDPVRVWTGGEWGGHPNGFQSAQVPRDEDAEALRCYCESYQYAPEDGHQLVVYVGRADEIDVRTYTFSDDEWELTDETTVDLKSYVINALIAEIDKDLLSAAAHLDLIELPEDVDA